MKNAVHMLKSVTNIQMMSFVLTTEQGGVILIDGGFPEDAEYLMTYLRELTGSEVPHIDAVWLTHAHGDHIPAFIRMVRDWSERFSFDRVYYNFPSEQFIAQDSDFPCLAEFHSLMPRFADRVQIVFGGDRFDIAGAHFEVLASPDYEFTMNPCNNSSIVFRVTLAGSTILFTGDCGAEAGRKIVRIYGDRLKSDYCQMAHHGQDGVEREFYERVRPEKGCFWCAPDWLWNNDAGSGFNTHTWKTVITRGWMDEIVPGHADYVIADGTRTVELENIDKGDST